MILLMIPGLAVVIALALLYGSRRWESATKAMHAAWRQGVCRSEQSGTTPTS